MNAALTVARKELRGLFQSPVAALFLGVFLVTTLFTFFSWSRFFARNLADVRPLFEWLPLLLILLVSAVTMRAWAEERKSGTLEVLLTLPVRTRDLVIGKFLAGMGLILAGLALTLPLPLVVDQLGSLDWGPVFGGYLAATLLASAYLAIGLCVSARTDNQVVALLVTLVLGAGLYLLGTERITALFGNEGAELLRLLGTGSRFESVQRGVIDARDLAYYGGITVSALVLNGWFLEQIRLDPDSPRGVARRASLLGTVGLTAANAAALNLWMAPLQHLRIDLTEGGEYSISPVTRDTLRGLDERLVVHGLFSERTHPLLAPLIPQIRDLLAEYAVQGGRKIDVRIVDPNEDPEVARHVGESYGVRPVPFGVSDRTSQSVVNSYFHIVIEYGDRSEVLQFQDLIDVQSSDQDVEVRLRNLEYDLTRAIRKVSQDFQPLDAVLAKLPAGARLTLYASPTTLPEAFQQTAASLRAVGASLAADSGGRLSFAEVDPSRDPAAAQRLLDQYGLQPMVTDLYAQEAFWLYGVLEAGDRVERILPPAAPEEAEARRSLEAAVRRVTPGQVKRVAIFTEQPDNPPPNPNIPPQFQPPPRNPDYRGLEEVLGTTYEVVNTTLDEGRVPDETDVLVVGKTGPTTAGQRYAIDQFLMRGGSVVALAGTTRVQAGQEGLRAEAEDNSLVDLLATWHVRVEDSLVHDVRNAPFPIPVQEQRGDFTYQRIELLPYPLFPDVRRDGLAEDHPLFAGVDGMTFPWASPLTLDADLGGLTAVTLAHSSAAAWIDGSRTIEPDFAKFPGAGFGPTGPLGTATLAVALTGPFVSNFAEAPSPLGEGAPRPLAKSVTPGKLIVVGSSEFAGDLLLQLAQQTNGEVHRGNLLFLHNVVDWATADTDLLAIRTTSAWDRALIPLTEDERTRWEWTSYAAVLLPLIAFVVVSRNRRPQPISLQVTP